MARRLNRYAAIRAVRVAVARRRLLRVLDKEVVAHQKELERRVCEVGFTFYPLAPQEERPEPVHLTAARNRLQEQDRVDFIPRRIRGSNYRFYHLTDADPALVAEALARKAEATKAFDIIQHDMHLSGFAAERYYHSAMLAADRLWPEPYQAGRDITALRDRRSTHGVDLAALDIPTRIPLVVQVKNIREWIYPEDAVIWTLLGTAAELEAVPVLMARRVPEPTFLLLAEIGGFAVAALNGWIDEAVYERPEAGRGGLRFDMAREVLGYKDVKTIRPDTPHPRFIRVFQERLADNLPAMHEAFMALRERVLFLARDEGLWDADNRVGRVSGLPRNALVNQFWNEVRGAGEPPPAPEEF